MQNNIGMDIEHMVKAKRGEIRKDALDTESILNDMEHATDHMDSALQTLGNAIDLFELCYDRLVAIYGEERLARVGFGTEYKDSLAKLDNLYDELSEARFIPTRLAQTFSRRMTSSMQ